MNTAMTDPVFVRLADVLEHERELLLTGQAAGAAALIEEKMMALQDFESLLQSTDVAAAPFGVRRAIEAIIQLAEENAAHMEAIRNGIRHAVNRLEAISSSAHVGSYRFDGAQMSFTNAIGSFNKKA
ncbi:hypothetical protein [Hyphomonas sp.]|uniref:hypothetical protein n=1 Tax=Hyphomonas sp. TaxID=87 RepID=UPI0025BE1F7E|nr:hypothetical protein [Hyphomonas sp.]